MVARALDGQYAVGGDARGADDRASGFDDQAGLGQSGRGTRVGQLRADPAGQRRQAQDLFAGTVGDAVAAAEVEFGQDQAVLLVQPRHQADHASHGEEVGLDAGNLGAQVAVQARQAQSGLVRGCG
ncbi:hypothetical protein GCM10010145_67440 [Streptomyces ruber]|uniref:Uncharacterized protein n=2 Tax=Streptomyces TaxID=1883 RepID=A0A918F0E5_9ACTN|nr:hypothetical protein GCM10010145_67440 [Streptomyces ruber]